MEKKDFRPYLEPDEYVVWQGKPEKGNYFRQEDIFRVPFGLFFFGFSVVWASMASQADVGFSLFALPFMIVGLYISVGIIIHRAILLSKTEYAITNRKLIRISGSKVDIVYGNQINNMQIMMNKDGTGRIIFLRQEVHYHGTDRHISYPGNGNPLYHRDRKYGDRCRGNGPLDEGI